tara:strand:- start:613 stop:2640 length:2028 start_codon:yes stop_codon:yes gene_type:complete
MLNNHHQFFSTGQLGEKLVLVLLKKGPVLARYLGEDNGTYEIELSNKTQAKLAIDRILLAMAIDLEPKETIKSLNKKFRTMANDINLSDTWKTIKDFEQRYSAEQIGRIYFGHPPSMSELAVLVIHLETNCMYFDRKDSAYLPAQTAEIEAKFDAIISREQKKELSNILAKSLGTGSLPNPLTSEHETLINHIRGFVVHGKQYDAYKTAIEIVRLIETGPKDSQRKAWEVLIEAGVISEQDPVELERANIPVSFSSKSAAQAKSIKRKKIVKSERCDLTNAFTITVDNEDTRDRDDAISIEIQSSDTVLLGVHITDVGAILDKDSAIDLEARLRETTIYLPELIINMLPDELSEGILSLQQDTITPAISIIAKFVSNKLENWDIFNSYIKPNEVITYEQFDHVLLDPQASHFEEFTAFNNLTKSLRSLRGEQGAVLLNRPELDIRIDSNSVVSVGVKHADTPGKLAIAEAMVLANSLFAKFCAENGLPIIYRAQEIFEAEAYETRSPNSSDILGQHELMRKIPPAYMTTLRKKHSGLGLDQYVQATSPIRRFCDLVAQRQISYFLKHREYLYSATELENIVEYSSAKSKHISSVIGERKRYWFLKWLEGRMDDGFDEYQAVVLASNWQGLGTLEMTELPFRFKAKLSDLDLPGDIVNVRLVKIDLWNKLPKFNVI